MSYSQGGMSAQTHFYRSQGIVCRVGPGGVPDVWDARARSWHRYPDFDTFHSTEITEEQATTTVGSREALSLPRVDEPWVPVAGSGDWSSDEPEQ